MGLCPKMIKLSEAFLWKENENEIYFPLGKGDIRLKYVMERGSVSVLMSKKILPLSKKKSKKKEFPVLMLKNRNQHSKLLLLNVIRGRTDSKSTKQVES